MIAAQTVDAYDIKLVERPVPAAGQGQVVVKMLAVGICASDVQIYHGRHKYVTFPLVQGHEGIGIVHEVGPGVDHVKKGDRVNIQQQLACGECQACRKGRHNVCHSLKCIGVHEDGLFSEYFLSPSWNVIKVPDDFTTDKGMLVEPASVGVNCAQVAGVKPGERVVVIGAGIIGNFTAQASRAMGAADVMVADISDAKLDIARRNGITKCVNTKNADLREAILEAWGGELPEVVFDCAGVEATLKQAISVVANASRVVIVANFKDPVTLEVPTFQRREIAILSIMGTVKESSIAAIKYLHDGTMHIEGIISQRFPLAKIMDAYKYIDDNAATVMKVAIDIGE